MPRGRMAPDVATLQMALIGYQLERQKIDDKIRQIEAQLGGKNMSSAGVLPKSPEKKRTLSAAARRRIAAAQRKRWAEHRKRAAQASK